MLNPCSSLLSLGLAAGWLAQGASTQLPTVTPSETAQTIVIHDEDSVPLHTSRNETTLIVLPDKEKAMGVFCGDKTYWDVDVIPGAERYIAVKPSRAGTATDIHIVTDHNNSYTFQAGEGGTGLNTLREIKPSGCRAADAIAYRGCKKDCVNAVL